MSAGNGGATIDSLVTFKYKKKFSFSKRLNATTTDDDEAAGRGEAATNSEDSSLTDSDVEELREKNMNWKGSAKLKSPGAARLESSEDEQASKKKHKKHKYGLVMLHGDFRMVELFKILLWVLISFVLIHF